MNLSEIIFMKNGQAQFDLDNTIQFLQYSGRKTFGPHFKIYPEDYEIIYKILVWAVQDADHAHELRLSLKKGIILSGPVGCGKTSLLKLISSLISKQRSFLVKPCREIALEFSKNGYDTVYQYSRTSRIDTPICFDDLGVEPPVRYFGDSINVMGEILLSRYELFVYKGILTHATTNMNAEELGYRYGERVRSRLREMFNLISYSPTARDKRC